MKLKSYIGKAVLATFVGTTLFACSDDFPENVSSDKYTDLKSIKITNAGASGTEVLEGVINEDTKVISFPRVDTLSDFSSLRFEAVTSEGAALEKSVFTIPYESGDTETDVILKVTNNPRFKEYRAAIRFKVPVYGANFATPTVFDYSENELGNPVYEAFSGLLTRGSGFDGEYVLVVRRDSPKGTPHVLKVSDLKAGVIKKMFLDMTGVAGGTFDVSAGGQVNGHSYIVNLSTSQAQAVSLYHWASPTAAAEKIASIDVSTVPGAGSRHGDNFSINLDNQGNGYAFLSTTDVQILRLKIENYSKVTETTVLTAKNKYGQWAAYNQVGDDQYLLSGHDQALSLVNSGASASYTLNKTSLPGGSGVARVIDFNGTRYLMTVTVPRGAPNGVNSTIRIYDISKGANLADALTAFEQGDKKVLFEYVIANGTNAAPGTQSGYKVHKDAEGKDNKLVIYAASANAGFAIIEFPVNVVED
ncbi:MULTISPECIES: DUF4623 domain-containing protein [Sphingobacterium]|uniref:DUF4623 domain-containing protein n=1 Tax=Sphingobacterium TaxID=28453 RepID=UPI0013DC90BA|nr:MULTISPECIES: DUF4623 domain-containing protein [unclassified Sphingobacterium]